jgi:hypothetical protein
MNNDLISKEDIAREFEFAEKYVIVDDSRFDVNEIKKRIMRIPTVDAEPVRHGKWIEPYKNDIWDCYQCSCCKLRRVNETPYCPNCGAKMDAEVE